ncbi:MAG: capsular biosynthesis protein CpsI [Acidobacteria bacterium]|nr:MAG: capsular biosynthesis protein CpsI [Acidobacteriota bacterium]
MILVTGAAGFIGYHVTKRLLERGDAVVGIDNLNPYYDPKLKEARLQQFRDFDRFEFVRLDVADRAEMASLFRQRRPQRVIHLAAQAGVRYSVENPHAYVDSNVTGFLNVLEGCRHNDVEHLVYASTSSVYGANTKQPFSEHQNADHPVSLYGATKKANEMMAHSYAHLYRLPVTGLRFFTVYGPWGRPDMALFKFTRGILAGEPIPVFNEGRMIRDFTYIDDVAEGVVRILDRVAGPDPKWDGDHPDPATSNAPYRIYNIGNNHPVELMTYISVLEHALGRKAKLDLLPMQAGDVPSTMADVSDLERATGFRPRTSVEEGIARFVTWYREYYRV